MNYKSEEFQVNNVDSGSNVFMLMSAFLATLSRLIRKK